MESLIVEQIVSGKKGSHNGLEPCLIVLLGKRSYC
jgi:hypothetical protein